MFNSTAKQRTWGFRFSIADTFALIAFAISALLLNKSGSDLWWLLLIAAGHFFLFCNILRLIRRLELIWAVLFILNLGIWFCLQRLTGPRVLLCQLPVTFIVILVALKATRYHGIFAKRLNPRLNAYLEGRIP